jgi:hypothetical protein
MYSRLPIASDNDDRATAAAGDRQRRKRCTHDEDEGEQSGEDSQGDHPPGPCVDLPISLPRRRRRRRASQVCGGHVENGAAARPY